jgi:penicillin-binding protein 2
VQSVDHEIVTAYELREKRSLNVSAATMEQIRTGMIEVVNGPNGTGHEAQLDGVEVAGKTGTAQWGPKNKERTAAWFAGFLPAEEPRYAFAAVYEGDVGSKVHGGTTAAPMIADIFQEIYKGSAANKRGTREPTQQVRRAQPVDEDDSD